MSDTAATILVTGLSGIATMLLGFFTLWIKLKYGAEQAELAASKAVVAVAKAAELKKKVDDNAADIKKDVQALHVIVNDRLSQLLARTEAAALAEGNIQGIRAEAARAAQARSPQSPEPPPAQSPAHGHEEGMPS